MAYDEGLAERIRAVLDVSADGVAEDADLTTWVTRGTDFAGSLAPK